MDASGTHVSESRRGYIPAALEGQGIDSQRFGCYLGLADLVRETFQILVKIGHASGTCQGSLGLSFGTAWLGNAGSSARPKDTRTPQVLASRARGDEPEALRSTSSTAATG
jgi:hypothetical protein